MGHDLKSALVLQFDPVNDCLSILLVVSGLYLYLVTVPNVFSLAVRVNNSVAVLFALSPRGIGLHKFNFTLDVLTVHD